MRAGIDRQTLQLFKNLIHDQLYTAWPTAWSTGISEIYKIVVYSTIQILPPAALVSKHWQNNFVFLAALASLVTSQAASIIFQNETSLLEVVNFWIAKIKRWVLGNTLCQFSSWDLLDCLINKKGRHLQGKSNFLRRVSKEKTEQKGEHGKPALL